MSPLHELIVVNRRWLRYALGLMLFFGGGLILALEICDSVQRWF